MIRMFVTAGLAAGLWAATLPASAEVATPETFTQKACKAGWVWDASLKRCVRAPRGSYN